MPTPHPKTVLVPALLLSLFLLNTVSKAAVAQQHSTRKRPAKQEQPAPPPPPAPPPLPPTLEQMPAVPPKVRFNNGLLTIIAENSTLSDILRAVRAQTGAAVEIPPNATERVVARLGPGAPRDVLASLLNGSHFNYVMLGSPTNPNVVDRVILTSKSGGMPEAGSAPLPPGQDNTAAVPMEEPEPQQGADIAEQPLDDAAENAANEENQPQPPNGQPQVKTPEQLLRELQQQQQQQQQQQPPQGAPPGPAPQ